MGLRGKAIRLLALSACAVAAGVPFACGSGFTAGSVGSDSGSDSASDSGSDTMAPEGSTDGPGEATPVDAPVPVDGVALDAGGSTVEGKVVDAYLLPMGGLDVHSEGQKATTAPDGTFTLTGITKPYTATVVVPQTGGHKHGYVFEGVSRLDPTLQVAFEQAQALETAALSGAPSASATISAGIVFADFPAATPATTSPTIPVGIGASTYAGKLGWTGGTSATPTVYFLEWLTTANLPSGYIAYSSAPQTLTGGVAHTWTPDPSTTLSQGSMTVTVTPSSGYTPIDIGVFLRPPGAGVAAPIQHGVQAGSTTSTVITPDVPNATFVACGLQVLDDFDGGQSAPFGYTCTAGLGVNDSPDLQPPPATTFVSPPSTAAIGTVFNYAAMTNGVYVVAFTPTAATSNTSDVLFVVTAGTQAAVPDLSLLAFVFHTGDAFTAQVYGLAPFTGIDGALGPTGFDERLNDYHLDTGPSANGSLAYSGASPFTVQ